MIQARRKSGCSTDDQTHILTLIGSYVLPRNWQIGGRFRLVSGNPITPVTGSVYNASIDRYFPTYGPANSDRLPFFSQLDVRVDKRWIYQGWMLDLYLDIQNVTNRTNTEKPRLQLQLRAVEAAARAPHPADPRHPGGLLT